MPGAFNYGMIPANSPKGTAFQSIQPAVLPAGIMQMFAGSTAPTGWLICDGSTVSRRIYSDLFKVIGTTYGSGDSNTTFTLPDMRGRVPMGVGQGVGLTNRTLASTTGAESVAISTTELPSHNHTASDSGHSHTASSGNDSPDHTHGIQYVGSSGAGYGLYDTGSGRSSGYLYSQGATARHTHAITVNTGYSSISVGNTGSGSAHNNMQPSIAINFIIKV